MSKYKSHGIQLEYSADGGTTWVVVAHLRDFDPASLTAENTDSTTHDGSLNSYRDRLVTILDAGDMSMELAFDPADTGHQWLSVTGRGDYYDYRVTWPDTGGTTWAFKGQVTNFSPKAPVDGLLSADVTINCKGAITVA